ncbi:sugar phosphate isomerase/epimerase family protein [Kushneria indalinina]|uniref:Xylose isomerase-like TIM barrel protein n=1 Tax=Kushneria indalinina DSM 14324 TaxID=1122140 RepID=A0A3D9E280_9GAMM|nr:TIM barrel protein [Kushneria indalinina]REC96619.1 xylose isomerase-like TIM barrel protein [Kushneria indalinina DSM 14324]
MGPVMICTSAFGADRVKRLGQAGVLEHIRDAGAQGVEIREELLSEHDLPLEQLRLAIEQASLTCVYSATMPLFDTRSRLNATAIDQAMARAETLGAQWIKFGLGQLYAECIDDGAAALKSRLADSTMPILIENDQTSCGGDPLIHAALHRALDASLFGTTLDLGNGYWTDHDLSQAASRLGRQVQYVHCKAVTHTNGVPHASPPDNATRSHWIELWHHFPADVPRAIEFPLDHDNTSATARHVELLRALA